MYTRVYTWRPGVYPSHFWCLVPGPELTDQKRRSTVPEVSDAMGGRGNYRGGWGYTWRPGCSRRLVPHLLRQREVIQLRCLLLLSMLRSAVAARSLLWLPNLPTRFKEAGAKINLYHVST